MDVRPRHEIISELIERATKKALKSKKAARQSLMATGIYTQNGQLAPEYGGPKTKKVVSRA
jgi:hypothetical protein